MKRRRATHFSSFQTNSKLGSHLTLQRVNLPLTLSVRPLEVSHLPYAIPNADNCRQLGRAYGKSDTSKGRTDKVRGRLALVKRKV